jgi:hypothetical protein
MNDKEAFEKWWQNMYDSYVEFRDWQGCDIAFDKKEDMRIGWQAALSHARSPSSQSALLKSYNEKYETERQRSAKLVKTLEEILGKRRCSSHLLGDCPSSDEKDFYIPAFGALKDYASEAGER